MRTESYATEMGQVFQLHMCETARQIPQTTYFADLVNIGIVDVTAAISGFGEVIYPKFSLV